MSHIENITHIKATYVNCTHEKENNTYSEWKDHITKWNNEYIKCNDRGLQTTELSTWTINNDSEPNWTQQNQKNLGELKSGLNKNEITPMMTIIKMRSALSWTTAKWCTHVDWTKSSTRDISKYHTTVSTINIQINPLKTRRRGTVCVECVGKGVTVTLGPDKLTSPASIKSCRVLRSVEQ